MGTFVYKDNALEKRHIVVITGNAAQMLSMYGQDGREPVGSPKEMLVESGHLFRRQTDQGS